MITLRNAGRHLCRPRAQLRPCIRWLSSDTPSSSGEKIISIDRSGLYNPQSDAGPSVDKEEETEMARHLKALITVGELWGWC